MGIQYCEYIRELKYITGRHRPNHQRPILVFTQPDSVNKPVTCIEVYSTYANVFNVVLQWYEIISELSFWFLFTYSQAKNVWRGWFLAWNHDNYKNLCYPRSFDWCSWEWSIFYFKFFKMADSRKLKKKAPILDIFSQIFQIGPFVNRMQRTLFSLNLCGHQAVRRWIYC